MQIIFDIFVNTVYIMDLSGGVAQLVRAVES